MLVAMTVCSRRNCSKPAVIYQKYSGLHLCREHFLIDVERKVRDEMRKHAMIGRNERIAVALSGGKDSSVLLFMLKRILKERRDLEIFAISVDEGIGGFRDKTIENARRVAEELSVQHHIFSFESYFGLTVDDFASAGFEQAPCSFCGVLRRKLIEKKARELGATKVAVAHNLDDEAQTIMLNYLKGDFERLIRLNARREEFIPRIKPLRSVPEKEIALYAIIRRIPFTTAECPYVRRSLRFSVKKMLNDMERLHAGIKYSVVRGYERLVRMLPSQKYELRHCEICGYPSASDICKSCEMLTKLRQRLQRGD